MRLPRIPELPDLTTRRALVFLALAVTVVVALILGFRDGPGLRFGYGDTDDATRIVLARQLLHGRGWWDQKEMLLQPPLGIYLHWSRLLDGGIALMERTFALFLSWNDAEALTRLIWPLLWIFPAVLAALVAVRRLSGLATNPTWSLLIAAVLLTVSYSALYVQFHPGRVDHHDVQMVFYLLAFVGALQPAPRIWGPFLGGVATGLGLAIGLEALVFDAVIGAGVAIRFAFAASEGTRLAAYAFGLVASTGPAFLIQTPPWRWSVVACDALAWNLVAAILVVSVGLALSARFTRGRSPWVRFAALAATAIVAGAVYLGLDRNCIHGPFADVNPQLKTFWLNYVSETAPIDRLYKRKPDEAIATVMPSILALIAWLWLGRQRTARTDGAWRLSGILLFITTAAGLVMVRAAGYALWTAIPLIAVAATDLAWRYRRVGMIAPIGAALLVMPLGVAGLVVTAQNGWTSTLAIVQHKKPPAKAAPPPEDFCFNSAPYEVLAEARPLGLVAGDIDFGPFVLALTPHATLSAPYHRMDWGILADRSILVADADDKGPAGAEARARALGVSYVLECPVHARNADRVGLTYGSLQATLDRDDWPDWLELISAEKAPIQVFKVLPPEGTTTRTTTVLHLDTAPSEAANR